LLPDAVVLPGKIKPGRACIFADISATRLSQRDPVGFPSHPHGWFSIVVYAAMLLKNKAQIVPNVFIVVNAQPWPV